MKTALGAAWGTVSKTREALIIAKSALTAISEGLEDADQVAGAALDAIAGVLRRPAKLAKLAKPPAPSAPRASSTPPESPQVAAPTLPPGGTNARWDSRRWNGASAGAWLCTAPVGDANVLLVHTSDGWRTA